MTKPVDAELLDLQRRYKEICEHHVEEATLRSELQAELEQVKIITAEMDCTDWCGKSSKYDSAGELKFDSRCPKCKLTEIVQLVGSKE